MNITLDSTFRNQQQICEHILHQDNKLLLLQFTYIILGTGGLYGAIMGLNHSWLQALTSMVKVPVLFFVTLLICISSG